MSAQKDKLIEKHKLESLPESIILVGFAMQRVICIDGKILSIKKSQRSLNLSDTFNWSYNGTGPAQLALAILMKYFSAADAKKLYELFRDTIIASLPDNNFDIKFKFRDFMLSLCGYGDLTVFRPVTDFLIDSKIELAGIAKMPGYAGNAQVKVHAGSEVEAPKKKVKIVHNKDGTYDAEWPTN